MKNDNFPPPPSHVDRPLGQVVLGGPMLARGSGEEHWSKATAAAKQKDTVLRWHKVHR